PGLPEHSHFLSPLPVLAFKAGSGVDRLSFVYGDVEATGDYLDPRRRGIHFMLRERRRAQDRRERPAPAGGPRALPRLAAKLTAPAAGRSVPSDRGRTGARSPGLDGPRFRTPTPWSAPARDIPSGRAR